jgi:hypothetical protein
MAVKQGWTSCQYNRHTPETFAVDSARLRAA